MSAPNITAAPSLGTPALARQTPSDFRNELTEMVIRDLLGPAGGPDEELNQYEDHAYQRYLVGMLAPKDERSPPASWTNWPPVMAMKAKKGHRNPACRPVAPIFHHRWA